MPVKTKQPLRNAAMIRQICSLGQYKIIHAHMDAMNYIPLKIAKKCGIPVRIAHSHNTAYLTDNKMKLMLNEYARKQISSVATHLWACSQAAGEWLFDKKPDRIVRNAIDGGRFSFDNSVRNKIRKQLNISDADIVVGHVGKFEYQKNHTYLMEIFKELHKEEQKYKLMLVGGGTLKNQIKEQVQRYGMDGDVIFIDECEHVNQYYNAFDILCFPSRFEGLSVVMIEAQCNGLKCIASDKIAKETDITGNVVFLPIEGEVAVQLWVDVVKSSARKRDQGALEKIQKSGYDIRNAAMNLQETYVYMSGMENK